MFNAPSEVFQKSRYPSAVIIKGNPEYVNKSTHAKKFYDELGALLRDKGYTVKFDKGKPYTVPEKADIWIGHSRGNDRLRFAPEGTKTLGLGVENGINHPLDKAFHQGQVPDLFHFTLTPEMRSAILDKLGIK